MIAQVRNQDPFQPMENGEFIAQMAQFATVDGIQEMQKSISGLSTTMSSNQALTASTLVGRSVLAPGGDFALGAEGGVSGAFNTDAPAASMVMNVYDAAGALVASRQVAAVPRWLHALHLRWLRRERYTGSRRATIASRPRRSSMAPPCSAETPLPDASTASPWAKGWRI